MEQWPNNRLQRTARSAAAEPERWATARHMSPPKHKCEICGRARPDTAAVCPACGGARQVLSDGRVITSYAPTVILGKNDPQTGHQGLVVSAPGSTSETPLSPSGVFSISVTGAYGLGKDGEPRVKKILRQRLKLEGVVHAFEAGKDSDGEDGMLVLEGQRFALQITMALCRERVNWEAASAGTSKASANIESVATWIHEVIKSKAQKTDPPNTILALDANHLGIMSGAALLSCYRDLFGSPSQRFGFAAVWLVGPTVERCLRLA